MIQTEGLCKQFGENLAVKDVTFSIQPGHVLALLGQNGAGKTTTVRMLTSILQPSRGWARVGGYDVVRDSEEVRRSVGVLTEQHGLYLRMTGREYLDYFGQVYGLEKKQRDKRGNELLEYFGLAESANQPTGQYSKGMRQKIALARALIHEPPVLLLDEPTSAMDPESAQLVRRAISGLRSTNRTILICTHNLIEAEQIADQIAIMYKGTILIQGTVDELKGKLLGKPAFQVNLSSEWRGKLPDLPQGVLLVEEYGFTLRFQIDNPEASNPILIKLLVQAGLEIVSMHEVPRSLDDVFITAMSQVRHVQAHA